MGSVKMSGKICSIPVLKYSCTLPKVLHALANGIDHLSIGQLSSPVSPLHPSPSNTISPPGLKLLVGQDLQNVSTPVLLLGSLLDSDCTQFRANSGNPIDMIRARNAVLTALPIPLGIPEDELKPIVLPASMPIYEFLNNTVGVSPRSSMLSDCD